ncbi:MAG TPA: c-type cytochrome [Pyrinomonadaceae bacterium]|nr:c-type cytochrome [Pyrinomonadaceae bacterium]
MADTPETDKLAPVPDPVDPARDPITSRSTSSILLICALLLTGVLAWALYDEVAFMRPWRGYQQSFVKRYNRYLNRVKKSGFKSEKEIKESAEYQRLSEEAKEARRAIQGDLKQIDSQVEVIDRQLAAVTDEFQERRGRITVASYRVENAGESDKAGLRKDVDELKQKKADILMPAADGSGKVEKKKLNYTEIESTYNQLKNRKAELLARRGDLLKEPGELDKKRDEYLKDNITDVTEQQVSLLSNKTKNFDFGLRQINVPEFNIVDRCETCHLGAREPIRLTAADMMVRGKRPDRLARAFVSHPDKELLTIHDPERFGCSSCHGGNGRATTTVLKAHGKNRFWLHPMHEKENMEAGCQQCHLNDRVLQGASTLTLGKDLFYERGCVGCHRYEGFDRESDALGSTRQLVKQLDDERIANEREARAARAESGREGVSDEEAQRLLGRAESLMVTNSQIESRMDQLNTQARYLMQDQKKVGPNLKDARIKLRKEWIPVWLKDPQAFRPGTKMPTFWYLSGEKNHIVPAEMQDNERKAIAAFIWQSAYEGRMPEQPRGDGAKGKELFETRGCLACHSIGEGDARVGGEFAANLTRLGEKANYDYIVRWVHNPRERWAPYCPKEKRDLSPEDYKNHGKPYVFDVNHTQCPNDGAELQVQNMTVMPNFRLTDADARDIATYLVSISSGASYPNADYMDDPQLKEVGRGLVKTYGCAGCHEIRGFEDEQRIGKELTTEGATPIERLDFALMTQRAERGLDAYDEKKKTEEWYNHKGFIEHKLADPSVYDLGKEKEAKEHLRMPKPFLKPEWQTALTTFLLGSVGVEGANVPTSLFYNPSNQQKDIQDGWWVIKKYNCMGCHTVQVGQRSILSSLPFYQENAMLGKEQLPPGLTTEGARVDPDWLLRFLSDPSLSNGGADGARGASAHGGAAGAAGGNIGGNGNAARGAGARGAGSSPAPSSVQGSTQQQPAGGDVMGHLGPQPGENRNGVRTYLRARMPTFSFSPNELRTLVRFFLAVSAQQEPYIKERPEPLSDQEMNLARALFSSQAAPCLKCHMTGDAGHDQTATAPNFLQAGDRLKPGWTFRWLLDPQRIMPGTAMPSDLFKKDGERWVFNSELPPTAADYQGDHAKLIVRYLLQLTPEEQARSARAVPVAPSGAPPAPAPAPPTPVASHTRWGTTPAPQKSGGARQTQSARRSAERRGQQVSRRANRRGSTRSRATQVASRVGRRTGDFLP